MNRSPIAQETGGSKGEDENKVKRDAESEPIVRPDPKPPEPVKPPDLAAQPLRTSENLLDMPLTNRSKLPDPIQPQKFNSLATDPVTSRENKLSLTEQKAPEPKIEPKREKKIVSSEGAKAKHRDFVSLCLGKTVSPPNPETSAHIFRTLREHCRHFRTLRTLLRLRPSFSWHELGMTLIPPRMVPLL